MTKDNQAYEKLFELKQKLQAKMETLKKELDTATHEYISVVTTLELLGHKSEVLTAADMVIPPSLLQGLTQVQALERIAKSNNRRLKLKMAKRLLVAAGLIKNPKNASNIIYTAIQRSEMFRKVGRGEYELIEKPVSASLTSQYEVLKKASA